MVLGSLNSAELRSQLICPPGAKSWSTACPAGVQKLDWQLQMVGDQPGYLPALAVLVQTRPTPRPVDEDSLLLLELVVIQLDPDL